MDFTYAFEPDSGLCVYRLSGKATVRELLACFAAARSDPQWSDNYDFLTILDHLSLSDMSADAMIKLMTKMREGDTATPDHTRRGAIVCNDPFSRAMLTYWELSAEHRLMTEERVFRFESKARLWLRSARDGTGLASGAPPQPA